MTFRKEALFTRYEEEAQKLAHAPNGLKGPTGGSATPALFGGEVKIFPGV